MATSNTDVERARQAGARRRARDEGRPLPPEPKPPAPPATTAAGQDAEHVPARATSPSTAPDARADGTAVPAAGTDGSMPASPSAAGPTTRGPWFDARAFFLGWLAMAIAFFAGASGFLVALVGFAAAYVFARRSRIVNALVAVAGGTAATVVLIVLLVLVLSAVSG